LKQVTFAHLFSLVNVLIQADIADKCPLVNSEALLHTLMMC